MVARGVDIADTGWVEFIGLIVWKTFLVKGLSIPGDFVANSRGE